MEFSQIYLQISSLTKTSWQMLFFHHLSSAPDKGCISQSLTQRLMHEENTPLSLWLIFKFVDKTNESICRYLCRKDKKISLEETKSLTAAGKNDTQLKNFQPYRAKTTVLFVSRLRCLLWTLMTCLLHILWFFKLQWNSLLTLWRTEQVKP